MKTKSSSGKLTFRGLLRKCAAAFAFSAVFFGTAASAATVTLAPGNNVTTNVPAFGGAVDVAVNTGTSGGGIVKMDPYNWYTGNTTLNCGVLGCENLIRQPYVQGLSDNATNRVYNVATGDAYVYWNGGEFRPYAAKLDPWASDARNATLDGLTEVLVSTNGAKISTAELKAARYTVKQALLHDPALEDAADGGFEKLGAGTLALAGSNTYDGATLVSEGLLELSADAGAAALPPGSLLDVATNAAVAFAAGTQAAAGGLRVDLAKGAGTITNLCPAAQGEFHVTSAAGVTLKGLRLPITVVGATRAGQLTRWPVYVDGSAEAVPGLCARVDNGGIVLGAPLGTVLFFR